MPQPISEHGRLGCGVISHIKIKQPDCNFCLVIRQMEKQQGKGPREADPCKSVCVGGLLDPTPSHPRREVRRAVCS